MAHFAEIDENNIVQRVVVVHNNELLNSDGVEQESLGAAFCNGIFSGTWVQTSYNGNMRKNFAAKGYTYDSARDAFIPPTPFNSWVLDEATCTWQAPVSRPNDGTLYRWNEETTSWVEVT